VKVQLTGRLASGAPTPPIVVGIADQLQQVCVNLCLNAVQAMPGGGTLELGCYGQVRRKPGLDVAPPVAYLVLEVADTGVGVPAEDRERIFEPFFSTKESGGTGLGLAVSLGIAKEHDGWIEVEGRPEGGTLFRVFLPAPEATT
jgi:signal transduction histidine kinase